MEAFEKSRYGAFPANMHLGGANETIKVRLLVRFVTPQNTILG